MVSTQPMVIKDFMHNTKIVATIGPSSSSYDQILQLVRAGVHVFRLNFSHGTHDQHLSVIQHIQEINSEFGLHIGIIADLQGPKLRIGEIEGGEISIAPDDILTFVLDKCVGNKDRIYMSYPEFAKDVIVGERVLVDDGKVVLEVVSTNKKDSVKLKVLYGSVLSSKKGVNLPDTKISQPSLTAKDRFDLDFILTQPVQWVALSFVRKAEDIEELKSIIQQAKHPALVMAKIEKPEALENLDAIVRASNAIMVARGDLGIEVPIERLPLIQKQIITHCLQWSRPVIVATQLMDSMIHNPSPTRAEVTDVANAVLDGADALMLSGETSVGDHPPLVVEAMNKIIAEAENDFSYKLRSPKPSPKSGTFLSDIVCFNAAEIAYELEAKGIVGMTRSGYTAFKVSSVRPPCKIYIFSDFKPMLATMNLIWGVHCFLYEKFTTTDETVFDVVEILKKNHEVVTGDILVNTGTMPLQKRGRTNYVKVTIVE